MTSRTITILNAAIAVVTVTAVTLDLQSRHRDHVRATSAARPSSRANGLSKDRPHLYNDVIDVRVDKLSSVPPSELYEVLMQATPEEIAALALKFNNLPPDGPSIGSVGMFFQAWAEIDGLAALEGAFRINDLQLKRMAAGTVIGSVSPALCADIAARLRNNPDPALLTESRGTYLDMLLERWAFVDGPASAKFYEELGNDRQALAYGTSGSICHAWATVDPYAALNWVEQQRKNQEIDGMMNELINGWCSRDLNAAAVYTMSHLEQVGSVGPTAVALSMFTTDPRRAGDWVRTLPAGEAKMIAEQNLGANWAQRDAPAAAHWVEDLPPEEQSQAVDSVVGRWVMNDRPAAVAWVGGLSGNMRDQAVRSVITTGQLAPDESLPLALSVSDPAQREELTQNVVIDWARTQPDLAAAWVRASGLPDQQKRTLLAQEIFFSPERYEPVIR